jgi:hypothetical protein
MLAGAVADDEGREQHWWHKPGMVTLLTALVGAMVPLAAGVQAYVQKQREIALEQEKNKQNIRLHYLDILVGSSLKDTEMFLSFISETEENPDLKQWAVSQLKNVEGRITALDADRAAADKRAADAEKQLDVAKASAAEKVRAAQADANASRQKKEAAEAEARKAQAALADAQRQADTRRAEALARRDALGSRRVTNRSVLQQPLPPLNAAAE